MILYVCKTFFFLPISKPNPHEFFISSSGSSTKSSSRSPAIVGVNVPSTGTNTSIITWLTEASIYGVPGIIKRVTITKRICS